MKPEVGWRDAQCGLLGKAIFGMAVLGESALLIQQAAQFLLDDDQPTLVFTPEVTYKNGQVVQKVVLHGRLTNWVDPVEIANPPEVRSVSPSYFLVGGQSADPKILFSGQTEDGHNYYLSVQSVGGENHYFLERSDASLDLGPADRVSVSGYLKQAFTWDADQSMIVDLQTGEIIKVELNEAQIQNIFAEWSSMPDDEMPGVEGYVLMILLWIMLVSWVVRQKK